MCMSLLHDITHYMHAKCKLKQPKYALLWYFNTGLLSLDFFMIDWVWEGHMAHVSRIF